MHIVKTFLNSVVTGKTFPEIIIKRIFGSKKNSYKRKIIKYKGLTKF